MMKHEDITQPANNRDLSVINAVLTLGMADSASNRGIKSSKNEDTVYITSKIKRIEPAGEFRLDQSNSITAACLIDHRLAILPCTSPETQVPVSRASWDDHSHYDNHR